MFSYVEANLMKRKKPAGKPTFYMKKHYPYSFRLQDSFKLLVTSFTPIGSANTNYIDNKLVSFLVESKIKQHHSLIQT
jgi:hypothetical protein